VINATIKSGTNEYHGNVFEYIRNNVLDANSWINNKTNRKPGRFVQNQFGGTFGGRLSRTRRSLWRLPAFQQPAVHDDPEHCSHAADEAGQFYGALSLPTPKVLSDSPVAARPAASRTTSFRPPAPPGKRVLTQLRRSCWRSFRIPTWRGAGQAGPTMFFTYSAK